MSVRRKVIRPKLRDYLSFEKRYFSFKNNILYNAQIFNHLTFQIAFLFTSFLAGFVNPLFWAVGLSFLTVIVVIYFKASRLAQSVSVTRKMDKQAREKSVIQIEYTITNETSFPLENLTFLESFDGVQSGFFKVVVTKTVPPQAQMKWVEKVRINGGMGLKTLNPLILSIEDEMGMFQFQVHFFEQLEIEVYPFIEETPKLKTSISPDSIDYGAYEVAKRGESNLFIGTREYRHGDPVKHINWKLSQKMQKIVLNEFEKNTNSYVTFIIDFEKENQLGMGGISTWEAAKDLALSMAINEIRNHNYIQVVANDLYIPFGNTKNQITLLEKHFTFHEVTASDRPDFLKYLKHLPAKGQIYYLCPFFVGRSSRELLDTIKQLKLFGHDVVVISLNPFQELNRAVSGDAKLTLLSLGREHSLVFSEIEEELKLIGIRCFSLKVDSKTRYYEQMINHAAGLLEDP